MVLGIPPGRRLQSVLTSTGEEYVNSAPIRVMRSYQHTIPRASLHTDIVATMAKPPIPTAKIGKGPISAHSNASDP